MLARLAMGSANVRAGTRVLMPVPVPVLVQAAGAKTGSTLLASGGGNVTCRHEGAAAAAAAAGGAWASLLPSGCAARGNCSELGCSIQGGSVNEIQ